MKSARFRYNLGLLGLLSLVQIPMLHAGEPEPVEIAPAPISEDSWQFSITPYGWLAGLDGTVGIGGNVADVDASFGDVLDALDMTMMLSLEARKGRWGFLLDGLWLKLSADASIPAPNIQGAEVDIEELRLAPMVSYRVMEGNTDFDVLFGLQYFSLDTDLAVTNTAGAVATVGRKEDWLDPTISFRVYHQLAGNWSLLGRADIGGFGVGSDLTWQVFGVVGYSWNECSTAYVGYRHLDIDYNHGDFIYDASTSGPVIGYSYSF